MCGTSPGKRVQVDEIWNFVYAKNDQRERERRPRRTMRAIFVRGPRSTQIEVSGLASLSTIAILINVRHNVMDDLEGAARQLRAASG